MSDFLKREQKAPILNMGVKIAGKDILVGQIISLNLKMDPFFMVGDIKLSSRRYWATVSDGREPGYYEVIRKGIEKGYVVLGKKQIPALDKPDGVLESWYSLVKKEGRSKMSVDSFRQLIKKGQDNNYGFGEIARYCLIQERNSDNRQAVIKLLLDVLAYADTGRNQLEVVEEEEGKITFKNTEAGMVMRREGVDPVPTPPEGHRVGNKRSSEILGDILEF